MSTSECDIFHDHLIMTNASSDMRLCNDIFSNQTYLSSKFFVSEDNSFDSNYKVPENVPADFRMETQWSSSFANQYYENPQLVTGIPMQNKIKRNLTCTYSLLPGQQRTESSRLKKGEHISEKPTIWRPFTPEPENRPSLSNAETNIVSTAQDHKRGNNIFNNMYFPTIRPSNVKLGSARSVFKAVKKKKYQCQYCNMNYFNNGQLIGHIRAHMGLRPYQCEFPHCSRAFARNEELTRHKRIHNGYKPHQCNICKKQFGRKDHLNKHSKTHLKTSEKKIYLCQISGCGHKYTRSDALTRHHTMAHSSKSL